MRSRSSSLEDGGGVKREEATARARRRRRSGELSRDDLLFLLSMLEGELQARDEVITVLRAEKMDLSLLEATYGFVTPQKVLRALQRDALQSQSADWQDDVYETPMSELERVVQTQRETYGRMLEQLLLVEQAHRQTLTRLEREKTRPPRHALNATPHCSGLLERQRLKLLIQQEKENQEKKEEENSRTVSSLKDELTRLKTFALQLVDEQQRLTDQLHQQTNQVHELQSSGSQAHVDLSSARTLLHQEQDKVLRLEQDLHTHTCRFQLEQETMTATLTNQDAQNRQLRLKLSALSRQVNELEEANKSLHRAQEELQELREKISRGECGDPGLENEVEKLRKRVMEMEGKDEELLRTEDICRDLHRKLEKESEKSRGLKLEVTELSTRILELEKLEEAFGRSKQECSFLKNSLEKERTVTKHMSNELDVLQDQIRELQASHVHLEKTELTLKEELTKLKTLTVILVDERRTMEEKLKLTEDKVHQSTGKLQVEQDKLNTITEKLIEESKKALRSKAELEEKMCSSTRERDELRTKLRAEERKNSDLQTTVSVMKKKLQSLEAVEKELLTYKSRESSTSQYHQQEDNNNKMNDLSQEVGRLKRKLKEMTMVESEFLNTEDNCELLDERLSIEQERTKDLTKELDVSRKELSKHQLAEKKEAGKEHDLHQRLKDEEAKSSHLLREVEALREKIHDYMSTEDLLSRLKTDYGSLQRKLAGQEVRNRELAREMEGLTRELERYRRFSKSLRPGLNGRRFSDLHVSSKEVQTEPVDSPLLKEATHNQINLSRCSSTLCDDLNNYHRNIDTNPAHCSFSQHPAQRLRAKSEGHDVLLRNSPAGPLHIRVTPDHAATLDITSPAAEHVPSFTSTALIPTRAGSSPLKQRITILQNTPRKASPPPSGPARALTPMQIVSVSTEPEETEGRWQRSSGPSIITTDDQKIHIHLGSNPFLQAASSAHCVSLSSQQKIPVSSKITSSILIKPTATAASRSTHPTTVPLESFRRSGPTRIPKPKGCSAVKGASGAQASLSAGKTLMDQTAQS